MNSLFTMVFGDIYGSLFKNDFTILHMKLFAMFINIFLNGMLKILILGYSYYVYSLGILDLHLLVHNNNKIRVGSHVFGPLFAQLIAPVSYGIFSEIIGWLCTQFMINN